MEGFEEYIGYIVFFVLFVLPRILKLFKRNKPAAPPADIPSLEEMLEGQTIELDDDVIEEPEADMAYLDDGFDDLAASANDLLKRVAEVERRVQSRGSVVAKMTPVITANLKTPVAELVTEIDDLREGRAGRNESQLFQIRAALSHYEKGLFLATMMVDQRLHPATSELLNTLDVAAKDCLMPYMVHARRLDIPYPTHFAVTIAAEAGFDAANALPFVAPLIVDEKKADLPRSWVQLVSDISLDVYHATPGLARQLALDLGTMPSPLSLHHYPNERALAQGLVGAWLPRLFADVGAATQIGPAFVSGLNANVGAGYDEQHATVAVIGQNEELPPMHVRMFAAIRTVARLGFAEVSKDIWETWRRRLDYPKAIKVTDRDGNATSISTAVVLDSIARVVDYLVSEPLDALGGYPLTSIPSLRCDSSCTKRMDDVARRLVKGEPTNAPGRILIGAALKAVAKSGTAERRIGDAALKSLQGKGIQAQVAARAGAGGPINIFDVTSSPDLAMRAVALGAALAPRDARQRR